MLLSVLSTSLLAGPQPRSGDPIAIEPPVPGVEWFQDAKFGIFLHWGIYAAGLTGESHPMNAANPGITPERYFAMADQFKAENYDPKEWAQLFQRFGARYTVITTKHHDGFALWDTQAPGGMGAARDSAAGRDLLQPFVQAMREAGLGVGFYFSHADWHHPDYASLRQPHFVRGHDFQTKPLSYAENDDFARWERFIAFRDAQIAELLPYQPDIWWLDGGWERTREQWRGKELIERIHAANPNVIFGRVGFDIADLGLNQLATPENALPISTSESPWELCMTTSDHWSYRGHHHRHWKSAGMLVQIFTEVIARNGNLLLNIGPKADGTLPQEAVEPMTEMGDWIARHAEAIYGTAGAEAPGIAFRRFHGPATVSRDGKTLYLFVHGLPRDAIFLRSVVSNPSAVTVLATGETLEIERLPANMRYPGHLAISLPSEADPLCTVIKLEFEDVIELGSERPQGRFGG